MPKKLAISRLIFAAPTFGAAFDLVVGQAKALRTELEAESPNHPSHRLQRVIAGPHPRVFLTVYQDGGQAKFPAMWDSGLIGKSLVEAAFGSQRKGWDTHVTLDHDALFAIAELAQVEVAA